MERFLITTNASLKINQINSAKVVMLNPRERPKAPPTFAK
jgi:hypothetical protein